MARLFQNPTLHNEFEEKGYVQLSLLNAQQVDHLLDVYHQFMGEEKETREGKEHLYESSRTHDLDWNLRMNEAIRNAFVDPVKPHFENYTLFGGTFMLKAPKKSTVLPLHQDWSVVDEDQYQSLFIWCPLVDIHPQNGGLFVLPGSHNYFKNYRSGSMQSQRIQPEGRIKKTYRRHRPLRRTGFDLFGSTLSRFLRQHHRGPPDRGHSQNQRTERGTGLLSQTE